MVLVHALQGKRNVGTGQCMLAALSNLQNTAQRNVSEVPPSCLSIAKSVQLQDHMCTPHAPPLHHPSTTHANPHAPPMHLGA